MIRIEDVTAYNQTGEKEPDTFICTEEYSGFSFRIHRHILPDTWFLSCSEVFIDSKNLNTNDFNEAYAVALESIKSRLLDQVERGKEVLLGLDKK